MRSGCTATIIKMAQKHNKHKHGKQPKRGIIAFIQVSLTLDTVRHTTIHLCIFRRSEVQGPAVRDTTQHNRDIPGLYMTIP